MPSPESLERRRFAFVVHIWQERRESFDREAVWRGSVDDASTGVRSHFATLGELMDYFRQHTGASTPAPTPPLVRTCPRA